jgi:hypothetical protein
VIVVPEAGCSAYPACAIPAQASAAAAREATTSRFCAFSNPSPPHS